MDRMPVARLLCASLPQQSIESCNSCQQSKVFRFHTAYHDALVTLAVFRASAMCDCPEKVIASSFFVASINVEGGSRERGTECARSSRCLVCHNE